MLQQCRQLSIYIYIFIYLNLFSSPPLDLMNDFSLVGYHSLHQLLENKRGYSRDLPVYLHIYNSKFWFQPLLWPYLSLRVNFRYDINGHKKRLWLGAEFSIENLGISLRLGWKLRPKAKCHLSKLVLGKSYKALCYFQD